MRRRHAPVVGLAIVAGSLAVRLLFRFQMGKILVSETEQFLVAVSEVDL